MIKKSLLIPALSIGLAMMARADTPKIQLEITVCPPTIKFKARIDTTSVGTWPGESLPFDGTATFDDVFVNGGNQVRCRYKPDNASGFKPSVNRTFAGKTCTASADNKSFTCR